jgi:hypothetical protein
MVRRKRGPKKSSGSRHPIDGMGSTIRGDRSLLTSRSGANVNVILSGDGPRTPNSIGSITSNMVAQELTFNPNAKLQHGRAQFRNEQNLHQHLTVNELAGFVIGDDGGNTRQTDSDWLLGFRNGSCAGHQASSATSTSIADNVSEPNTESGALTSTKPDWFDGCTPAFSSPLSVLPGTSIVLDGTALALATGMPLRYGPEMTQCVEVYFSRLYHVLPIIHEGQFRRLLASPSQLTTTDRGLFLAFCAATTLRSCQLAEGPAHAHRRESGLLFLMQHLRLRSDIDYTEETAPSIVISTFLVHVAFACLGRDRSARHYLREAISMSLELGFHKEETYRNFDEIESICIRRTLALIFVTERATAITCNQDVLLLRERPDLPDLWFDEQDRNILIGFQCLFGLFALLDEDTVSYWCSTTPANGPQSEPMRLKLYSVQAQLSNTRFEDKNLNDYQRADVLVTQQWLRLIFWQIAMRLGFLSSWSENPAFLYNYPVELGKDLWTVLQSLPKCALLVHHFSIVSEIPSL